MDEASTAPTATEAVVPIGSLSQVVSAGQLRASGPVLLAVCVAVIAFVAVALPPVFAALDAALGFVPAAWLTAAVAFAVYVLAVLVIGIVPPLLVRGKDRSASAVHAWIGARETRRALGRPSAAIGIPSNPAAAVEWLRSMPDTDALLPVRLEVLVLARRLDEARAAIERLPESTPFERYRRLEATALVDDQSGRPVDEAALRASLAMIRDPGDRAEATASLAVLLARRAVPAGRWRERLLEARPLLPGSDTAILVRDLGLVIAEILLRRTGPWVGALIFGAALVVTIASLLG